jgi:hypothetical protein
LSPKPVPNINVLAREDELSLRQAAIAIDVLQLFAEELLDSGQGKLVQNLLRDLSYVTRDGFVRGRLARHHEELNPLRAMKAFLSHEGLDERWRNSSLSRMINRLEKMLAR